MRLFFKFTMLKHFATAIKAVQISLITSPAAVIFLNKMNSFPRKIVCGPTSKLIKSYLTHSQKIPTTMKINHFSHGPSGRLVAAKPLHVSGKKRALHPAIIFILKPVVKLAAALFGRALRKWWQRLPPDKKKKYIDKIHISKFKLAGCLAVLLGLVIHFYLSHLVDQPITHRKQFIIFSPEQMVRIAAIQLRIEMEGFKSLCLAEDSPEHKRVVKVTKRILKANKNVAGMKNKRWTVTVIDHPSIQNAFVIPNGSIFIFTKILGACENDDQLAVILGHEMSHALLSHLAEQLSKVQLVEWTLLIVLIVLWAILPDLAAVITHWLFERITHLMFHLPFSRSLENEADQVGLQLVARACFDVRESSAFWGKMRLLTPPKYPYEKFVSELYSTHPSSESRVYLLNNLMPDAICLRENSKCPPLPKTDPRKNLFSVGETLRKKKKM